MQEAALAALGLQPRWRYQRLPVPPARFEVLVRALPALGFRGANVTIPHKEAALALADVASERARRIGAANTLTFEPDGTIEAENTDATGFLETLPSSPAGERALVLGAGGSARAVIDALTGAGASDVAVWNRTPERAAAVCAQLGGRPVGWDEARAARPAFVVNCTSVGLAAEADERARLPIDDAALSPGVAVVDLVYRAGGTQLVRDAAARGATAVDGLAMLVAQGAASLERWCGEPVPRDVMDAAVRVG